MILQGRRVLVVEDDYILAKDIATRLEANGAEIVGPASNSDDAVNLIGLTEQLDAALLDINLRGELAFPVADALTECGIPFVFVTGYDQSTIPARYSAVTRCEKPVDASKIAQALFG